MKDLTKRKIMSQCCAATWRKRWTEVQRSD